jgi:hypothetical protein
MTTTRRSHADCDHPRTPAARAACRKNDRMATLAGNALENISFPTPEPVPAAAPRLIAGIAYETVTCDRCAGSGHYPSAAWNGVCLKCSGVGNMLTANGRRAFKKYEEYLAANHTKYAIDLEPGDDIRKQGRWVRVHAIDPTIQKGSVCTIGSGDNAVTFSTLNIILVTKLKGGREVHNYTGPYVEMIVRPRGEAQQAAFRHVAHMKGCIVTFHEG